jgi:energy-converting hydrogenase Eha subunit E
MTDRVAAFIVVLDDDIRTDDVKDVITALGMIKGVARVAPVVSDINLHIATVRARNELVSKVLKVFELGPK